MIRENEVIMLLLGIGVLIAILLNLARLRRLPRWPVVLASFAALFCGWVCTVAEGFWLAGPLNLAEHLCYALSALGMAWWCLAVREDGDRAP